MSFQPCATVNCDCEDFLTPKSGNINKNYALRLVRPEPWMHQAYWMQIVVLDGLPHTSFIRMRTLLIWVPPASSSENGRHPALGKNVFLRPILKLFFSRITSFGDASTGSSDLGYY